MKTGVHVHVEAVTALGAATISGNVEIGKLVRSFLLAFFCNYALVLSAPFPCSVRVSPGGLKGSSCGQCLLTLVLILYVFHLKHFRTSIPPWRRNRISQHHILI